MFAALLRRRVLNDRGEERLQAGRGVAALRAHDAQLRDEVQQPGRDAFSHARRHVHRWRPQDLRHLGGGNPSNTVLAEHVADPAPGARLRLWRA